MKKRQNSINNFKEVKTRKKGSRFYVLIACLIIVYFIGFIGSIFTTGETSGAWYQSVKSSLTPPNWVFPIVWNILFFLIALSMYFAWINSERKQKLILIDLFGVNLIFNCLWSLLFFGLKDSFSAFVDIIIIWLSIIVLMFYTRKISRTASWLLLPYLIWVSFAAILNFWAIR